MARLGEGLRRSHGLAGKVTPPGRMALAVHEIGTFRGPPTRAVMDKARDIAAELEAAPFTVALDRAETWAGDPGRVVLTGQGADDFQALLHKALWGRGMASRREAPEAPHVLLMTDRRAIEAEDIEPITFDATAFVLLDAIVGEGRQEVIGRWPLQGEAW